MHCNVCKEPYEMPCLFDTLMHCNVCKEPDEMPCLFGNLMHVISAKNLMKCHVFWYHNEL